MTLQVENISKRFDGFAVLSEVSLTVPAGGLVGLIGPNGAGKSTLFSVISGFVAADGGSIALDGKRLGGLSPAARARAGLVRSFQVPREFSHLTVAENLAAAVPGQAGERLLPLFLRPGLVSSQNRTVREAAAAMAETLDLTRVAHQPAGLLSGGQKKLLELGRAMLARPKLVLLDEPFAGVNAVLIERIVSLIREFNRAGTAFLVVEHDLDALSDLTPTLYAMDQGRMLVEGTPDAVLGHPKVRDAYLGA